MADAHGLYIIPQPRTVTKKNSKSISSSLLSKFISSMAIVISQQINTDLKKNSVANSKNLSLAQARAP